MRAASRRLRRAHRPGRIRAMQQAAADLPRRDSRRQSMALGARAGGGSAMSAAACACGLVDVHTHWVPERFPAYLGNRKGVPWPSIAPAASACLYHVMIEGKVYRTIPDACWDLSRREQDMAAVGVARQVLSPMPELLSYWLESDDAQALVGFLNDELAA